MTSDPVGTMPGDWPNVQQRLAAFSPWAGDSLTVDGAAPLERNVETVHRYLDTQAAAGP